MFVTDFHDELVYVFHLFSVQIKSRQVIEHGSQLKNEIIQACLQGRLSRHEPAVMCGGGDDTVVNSAGPTKERHAYRWSCFIFVHRSNNKTKNSQTVFSFIPTEIYLATSISWSLIISLVEGLCCTSSYAAGFRAGHAEDKQWCNDT